MRIFDVLKPSPACMLVMVALSAPLAGCANVDRAVATSPVPDDYHLRHPVVLGNGRQSLDIFLVGVSDKLDGRQARDVQAFAAEYRQQGQGRILVQVPRDAADPRAAEATLNAIRRTLATAGVKGDIEVGSYRVINPSLAAPVHLSFTRLQAELASRCGEWPDDLGSGHTSDTWENRSYYNLGCASQRTLAAQIDDPRDLVRPRAEDPSDVQMRTRAIGDIRVGTDPSTNWINSQMTPIGAVGGN